VTKIRDIIKGHFQNSDHAWFNLNETSKEIYEMGKLKKFLTLVKFMMENTLLYMTQDSVENFVKIILEFVPESVDVKDSYTVENKFNKAFLEKREGGKPPPPLFNIDLMLFDEQTGEDGPKVSRPGFSTSPRDITKVILLIYDNGVKSL
jgi:dynein heavy chain